MDTMSQDGRMNSMNPSDAEVALRSLPRRFRGAVATARESDETSNEDERDDESPESIAQRPGPDGRSVLDHLASTITSLSLLDRAVELILTTDDPVLHPGVNDQDRREPTGAGHHGSADLHTLLEALASIVTGFADRVADAPADAWVREGRVAGADSSISAVAVLQMAVEESIDELKAVERTVAAVRRR